MLILLAVHAGVAAALPWWARRTGRAVWLLAALPPLAAVAWSATVAPGVLDGSPVRESLTWAPELGLTLDLRLDALALAMLWAVGGVGALVLLYCRHYVTRDTGREAGLLLAFAGAMTGLVLADNLLVLYVFWELTTVVSFLLIAGRGEEPERRSAAEQSLLTTAAGGLAMLLGFVLLGETAGTYRVSELVADPPRGGAVPAALVLILAGAFAKSAQYPLHGWLPAAMVAPTPVSAYLHAAAMVKAGVYLIARLAPGFADVGPWRPLVLVIGLASAVLGARQALRETDLKRLLAYGTISTLGMLTALLGAGTRTAALAGLTLLLAHAGFKAALFLATGILDHRAGTRDLRQLSGAGRRTPALSAVAALAAASLAGVPPLLGYLGKETAFSALLHGSALPGHLWATGFFVLAAVLTVAYAARYLHGAFGAFGSSGAGEASGAQESAAPREAAPPGGAGRIAPGFLAPVAVLALAGLVFGLWYAGTAIPATAYADAYPPGPKGPYKLALWHGLTPVLGLSALSLAGGLLLHAAGTRRRPYARYAAGPGEPARRRPSGTAARLGAARARLPATARLPDAQRAYAGTVRALDEAAVRLTRHTQVGSLPVYLTVLLATVVLLPGTALLRTTPGLGDAPVWRSAMEVPLGLVVLLAAVAVTPTRHRLTGVLLVGAVGYGVAGLFVVYGAPDLALTQFLVETMTLVIVVLVLRRMPARFTPGRTRPRVRVLRGVVALAVGALVAVFALAATAARDAPRVSGEYVRRAPETGAKNIVNAIIVDFRALDTLGEIAVLLVAATGVVSVVRLWGRPSAEGPAGDASAVRDEPEHAGAGPAGTDDAVRGEGGAAGARGHRADGPGGGPGTGEGPGTGKETGPGRPGGGSAPSGGRPPGTPGVRAPGEEAPLREAVESPFAAARWDEPSRPWLPGAHERPGGERSVLLEVVTRLLFPSVLVLGLFLLFSGHYRPGGGFAGGLVAGQAFVLRYLVGGRADFGLAAPAKPGVVAGSGLALAAALGLLPTVLGEPALSSALVSAHLPLFGPVKLATSLFLDVAIFLLVVGVTLKLLAAVGVTLSEHGPAAPGEDGGPEDAEAPEETRYPRTAHRTTERGARP